jgi:hypothetical protein
LYPVDEHVGRKLLSDKAQYNAPFYLTFLHEAEKRRADCRNDVMDANCVRDDVYKFAYSGEGVAIYSLGEAINAHHSEFAEGRISQDSFNAFTQVANCSQICEAWQHTLL